MQVSQSYGYTRPAAIAARLATLRARFAPVAIEVPAPVLALVPAAPKPNRTGAAQVKAARIAAQQAERAEIRADLPFMRHYAANFDDGPTWEEIEAVENRLADLDDFLIFEADAAENEMALAA
jgi:hypothetical protein